MSLITLKNVKKEYGKNQVLFENLSLEIEKGEFVGLVGKSGAGKTTLLNIIGLITDISEGTIIIDSHQNLSMNSKNAMILRRYTICLLYTSAERTGCSPAVRKGRKPVQESIHW